MRKAFLPTRLPMIYGQVHKILMHTDLSGFVSGTLANLSGDVCLPPSPHCAVGFARQGVSHSAVGGLTWRDCWPVRQASYQRSRARVGPARNVLDGMLQASPPAAAPLS